MTLLISQSLTAIGIPAATLVAHESGREDPGHVVIDEVAGQRLTLAVCRPDWPHALLALALFRLFDITKPWPIRKLEALPGGWGIMLDDLAAGLFGSDRPARHPALVVVCASKLGSRELDRGSL